MLFLLKIRAQLPDDWSPEQRAEMTSTQEELHATLQSLPMFPFMMITVTPVSKHPIEEAYERANGPIRGL